MPHAAGAAHGPVSAIPAEDWLPVQEGLLRGLNHALSNRLASVSALAMLVEGSDKLPVGMQDVLSDDVEKLSELLTLYRALPASVESRREPMRSGDAIARARALIEHHPECRDLTMGPIVEPEDAEPVSLMGRDAVRASVLLLLSVAHGAPSAPALDVTIRGEDGWLHVTVRCAGAEVTKVRATWEYAALERFAAAEGGRTECTTSPRGDAQVTLTLPGLSRARAKT
ncbi:MAG: hypothetical protein ACYC0B_03830 [Gemmatimonadaceae bacterium]